MVAEAPTCSPPTSGPGATAPVAHRRRRRSRADNRSLIYARSSAFGPNWTPTLTRAATDAGALLGPHRHAGTCSPRRRAVAWPAPTSAGVRRRRRRPGLAAAISPALYRRVSDRRRRRWSTASLLAAGLCGCRTTSANARLGDDTHARRTPDRYATWNPLMLPYRADDRYRRFMVLAPDPHWPTSARLRTRRPGRRPAVRGRSDARRANAASLRLDPRVGVRGVAAGVWQERLAGFAGEWTVVQSPADVATIRRSSPTATSPRSAPSPWSPRRPSSTACLARRASARVGEDTEAVLLGWAVVGRGIGALRTKAPYVTMQLAAVAATRRHGGGFLRAGCSWRRVPRVRPGDGDRPLQAVAGRVGDLGLEAGGHVGPSRPTTAWPSSSRSNTSGQMPPAPGVALAAVRRRR